VPLDRITPGDRATQEVPIMTPRNHPFSIRTTLALALALSAIAPAGALAKFDLNPTVATTTPSPQPAVQIVRVTAPGGFDWGDAGIGAAGGLGLSMLAIGGGLVITQRRERRSNGPTAATS
jgi:hypothetical protein